MRYRDPFPPRLRGAVFVWAVFCLGCGAVQAQEAAGKVDRAQGLVTAQQPGAAARLLEGNDALREGDTITTTEHSYAVLSLADGSRLTLRPATTFVIERFSQEAGRESAFFRLLKGGLRALTGLIGKRKPEAVRFNTATATIGVRGTAFDARICGADCRREEQEAKARPGARPPAGEAGKALAGRIARLSGEASAGGSGTPPRPLREGSPIYVGEEVATGAGSFAVIAFRDHGAVSLEPATRFRVDDFAYRQPQKEDNVVLRLLKGGMRAFTGLIAKTRPGAVKVNTVVATIGVRGTGMDIRCEGPCAGEPPPKPQPGKAGAKNTSLAAGSGLFATVWEGRIYFSAQGLETDIDLGLTGFAGASGTTQILPETPAWMKNFTAPRPDQVPIDWDKLFASSPPGEDGLYLHVREGRVFLQGAGGLLEFDAGESGFVGEDGVPRRIEPTPQFLLGDPFPLPELTGADLGPVDRLFGVNLGDPGQVLCEMN